MKPLPYQSTKNTHDTVWRMWRKLLCHPAWVQSFFSSCNIFQYQTSACQNSAMDYFLLLLLLFLKHIIWKRTYCLSRWLKLQEFQNGSIRRVRTFPILSGKTLDFLEVTTWAPSSNTQMTDGKMTTLTDVVHPRAASQFFLSLWETCRMTPLLNLKLKE